MSKLKVDQFVELVKRSGLVDDARLNQALGGVDVSVNDSGIIASTLTKAGLLTEWQSEKLLQGKHKGFYLGKYKLLNHIGTGGMGSVYLAEHMVMRHRVAIKLLPNHLATHTSYLERFHQEARASAQLNHPNMVRATDVDHDGNNHYLVMEYVEGTNLQDIVSRHGPLDYGVAAEYTRQAAEGLAYAHRVGLIHRDIKPANLLVNKEGTVKILDMGLARFTDESQGSLTMAYDQKMIGTVDYLSPEQALDSHKVDSRVDIYSLGCTLYFMLSGDAPFPTGTIPQRLMAHQKEQPTDVRKTRPDAPEDLLAICKKMMAKAPGDRYQTADDVVQAITEYLGDRDSASDSWSIAKAPPPSGPSLNEDLDLAPLEDEPVTRGQRPPQPGDSKGSGVTSKSGVHGSPGSGVKKGGSSVIRTGAGGGDTVGGKHDSSVHDAGRPGSKSGVKPGNKSGPQPPARSKADEMVDDLMAAPTVQSEQMPVAPSPLQRKNYEQSGFHLWIVVVIALSIAAAIGGALYGLLWLIDSMRY